GAPCASSAKAATSPSTSARTCCAGRSPCSPPGPSPTSSRPSAPSSASSAASTSTSSSPTNGSSIRPRRPTGCSTSRPTEKACSGSEDASRPSLTRDGGRYLSVEFDSRILLTFEPLGRGSDPAVPYDFETVQLVTRINLQARQGATLQGYDGDL